LRRFIRANTVGFGFDEDAVVSTSPAIFRHPALAAFSVTLFCIAPILFSPQSVSAQTASPTFYRDVLPILQNHCQSCHRAGEIAPMALVTYTEARPLARVIATTVAERKMPPWFADPTIGHFSNDPSLTEKEIGTLVSWADANAPAGDPSDAPPPPQWTRGG
jgi:hypothetical protein